MNIINGEYLSEHKYKHICINYVYISIFIHIPTNCTWNEYIYIYIYAYIKNYTNQSKACFLKQITGPF